MPEVLNAKALGWITSNQIQRNLDPATQAYVGRPTLWGNPFIVNVHGSRSEVIDKYRDYILQKNYLLNRLIHLRQKDLICWCAPQACHADVLLELVND